MAASACPWCWSTNVIPRPSSRPNAAKSSTTAPQPLFCNNISTLIFQPMPNPTDPSQLDAEALYGDLLLQVRAGLSGVANAAIVGIHSGGAWLAERLAGDLGL